MSSKVALKDWLLFLWSTNMCAGDRSHHGCPLGALYQLTLQYLSSSFNISVLLGVVATEGVLHDNPEINFKMLNTVWLAN